MFYLKVRPLLAWRCMRRRLLCGGNRNKGSAAGQATIRTSGVRTFDVADEPRRFRTIVARSAQGQGREAETLRPQVSAR